MQQMQQMSIFTDVLRIVQDVSISEHLDLFMFFSAVVGYYILHLVHDRMKAYSCEKTQDYSKFHALVSDVGELDATLRAACEAGENNDVVEYWKAFKQSSQVPPSVRLFQAVTAMRICKQSPQSIASEVLAFLQTYPSECNMSTINELLECLGNQRDSQLASLVVDMLPSLQLALDQHSCEILLAMYVKSRQFYKARHLLETKARDLPLTARAVFFALKMAISTCEFDQAMHYLRDLKESWQDCGAFEPLVPHPVMVQLIELACKRQQIQALIEELDGVPLPAHVIECVSLGAGSKQSFFHAAANCGRLDVMESLLATMPWGNAASYPIPEVSRVRHLFAALFRVSAEVSTVIAQWVVLVF